jgi:hypothetical protein
MRGNKDLFPPPSCWTRGVQEGEESLFSLLFFLLQLSEDERITRVGLVFVKCRAG